MTAVLERRTWTEPVEFRAEGNNLVARGYAVVYGKRSQNLGGFVEVVQRGAATKTIQEADVMALANHDPNLILGRKGAGTLTLSEDERGVPYEILLPDTTVGRDWAELLRRNDVIGSSFGFRTIADSWGFTEDGFPLRTLEEFALRDVGPVTFPAYSDSSASLRYLAESRSLDLETLIAAAAVENGIRSLLTANAESEGREDPTPPTRKRKVMF
jgi:uncharacterized protein